jgi:hypothetical protein
MDQFVAIRIRSGVRMPRGTASGFFLETVMHIDKPDSEKLLYQRASS